MGYAVQHGMHFPVTAAVGCDARNVVEVALTLYTSSWGSLLQELLLVLSAELAMPQTPFLLVEATPLASSCKPDSSSFKNFTLIDRSRLRFMPLGSSKASMPGVTPFSSPIGMCLSVHSYGFMPVAVSPW